MHSRVLRRCGVVLAASGAIGIVAAMYGVVGSWPGLIAGAIAILSGIVLVTGHPPAAAWVHAAVVFLLAAGIAAALIAPLFQPLDLLLTAIRLDPTAAAANALRIICVLGVLAWVTRELGRAPVQDAVVRSGGWRLDPRMAVRAGGGVALVAGLLLWLTLHGQSAELADQLALEQLGPAYRYHLGWISSGSGDRGRSVSATVIAWNATEIRTVLIHWEGH